MTPSPVSDLLAVGCARLERAGIEPAEARLEVEVLLAHALGVTRTAVLADARCEVDRESVARFEASVARRERREPLAYIVGERELFSLRLAVAPGVLIPRPETETLVEETLAEVARLAAAGRRPLRVLDIGTGSGAIAVAVAAMTASHGVEVVATDRSPAALRVATENARAHGVLGRVRVVAADLAPSGETFDVIASNPPYVTEVEHASLAPEVRDHEPREALVDPEPDGLGITRRIARLATRILAPAGALLVEIGAGRASAARAAMTAEGLDVDRTVPDLAGIERVVVARPRG